MKKIMGERYMDLRDCRILLVDDEKDILNRILSKNGNAAIIRLAAVGRIGMYFQENK